MAPEPGCAADAAGASLTWARCTRQSAAAYRPSAGRSPQRDGPLLAALDRVSQAAARTLPVKYRT
jgi:hypothetical protein